MVSFRKLCAPLVRGSTFAGLRRIIEVIPDDDGLENAVLAAWSLTMFLSVYLMFFSSHLILTVWKTLEGEMQEECNEI